MVDFLPIGQCVRDLEVVYFYPVSHGSGVKFPASSLLVSEQSLLHNQVFQVSQVSRGSNKTSCWWRQEKEQKPAAVKRLQMVRKEKVGKDALLFQAVSWEQNVERDAGQRVLYLFLTLVQRNFLKVFFKCFDIRLTKTSVSSLVSYLFKGNCFWWFRKLYLCHWIIAREFYREATSVRRQPLLENGIWAVFDGEYRLLYSSSFKPSLCWGIYLSPCNRIDSWSLCFLWLLFRSKVMLWCLLYWFYD